MKEILRKLSKPGRGDPRNHADFSFWCPGCKCGHSIWTETVNLSGAKWKWNGSFEKPTFEPSLLVAPFQPDGKTPGIHRCHSVITDGIIHFQADCTHELRGKSVPMEAFYGTE